MSRPDKYLFDRSSFAAIIAYVYEQGWNDRDDRERRRLRELASDDMEAASIPERIDSCPVTRTAGMIEGIMSAAVAALRAQPGVESTTRKVKKPERGRIIYPPGSIDPKLLRN